jgi:hypothetical protein
MTRQFILHTNQTKGRWVNDRRFNCVTTTICILETTHDPAGDSRPFSGLSAHTDDKTAFWTVYEHGKYHFVDTEVQARSLLTERMQHYLSK